MIAYSSVVTPDSATSFVIYGNNDLTNQSNKNWPGILALIIRRRRLHSCMWSDIWVEVFWWKDVKSSVPFIPNWELKLVQEGYSQSFEIHKRITWQLNVPLGRHPFQCPLKKPKPNTVIHERVWWAPYMKSRYVVRWVFFSFSFKLRYVWNNVSWHWRPTRYVIDMIICQPTQIRKI